MSFNEPLYTADTDGLGTLRLLEAIRLAKLSHKTKFYQASTSELFGKVQTIPQTEDTPFYPRSPYAVAKLYAFWITKNYREAYDMFACNGILFNHESPLRGSEFVTRKITRGLARIKLGLQDRLYLGNLDAKRDWGHAIDYVEAQWLMLQQNEPRDFVIATGKQYTVRQFIELACENLEIELSWEGQDLNERGYNKDGQCIIAVNEEFYRPAEVDTLLGDPKLAGEILGWKPKISFESLVKEMTMADFEEAKRDAGR